MTFWSPRSRLRVFAVVVRVKPEDTRLGSESWSEARNIVMAFGRFRAVGRDWLADLFGKIEHSGPSRNDY